MRVSLLISVGLAALALVGGVSASRRNHDGVSDRIKTLLELDYAYQQGMAENATAEESQLGAVDPSSVFNFNVAMKMFWHSVTAYCTDDPALADWTCASCTQFGAFTVTGVMDDTANQGYVGYFKQGLPASPIMSSTKTVPANSPFVVVAMRGTVPSNIQDWIENLSQSTFSPFSSNYPSAKVHSGFWGAYNNLKPGMMEALKTAISDSGATTILFAGHSLGAAMAELAAIDLKLNEFPNFNYASYTVGTPRVGNQAFADLFTANMDASFREVHWRDIVAHLPPLIMGFRHGYTEIFYSEDNSSIQNCWGAPVGEDPSCSDQFTFPISISDHLHYHGIEVGDYCNGKSKLQPMLQAPKTIMRTLKGGKPQRINTEGLVLTQ